MIPVGSQKATFRRRSGTTTRATLPSNRRWRMRGSRRPSRSGCDQGLGSGPINDWNATTNSGAIQRYCNGPATGPATLQRGSSEGRARVQRGSSVGQVSGLSRADRGLRERIGSQARRHLLGLTGPLRGGKDPTAPATSGQQTGSYLPETFHPKVFRAVAFWFFRPGPKAFLGHLIHCHTLRFAHFEA